MGKKPRILPPTHRAKPRRQKLYRVLVNLLVWIGVAALFYVLFSFFFDTPREYRLKQSMGTLREEYDRLENRLDTLERVLDNVSERDRNVFRILFESEPYDTGTDYAGEWHSYAEKATNTLLADRFSQAAGRLEAGVKEAAAEYERLQDSMLNMGRTLDHIPAIQPVINKELTLLTASYGMRIHPFYKSLSPHQGVDYTVPEGSRVFATADGTVKEVTSRATSSGLTVVLSHEGGYETLYSHLGEIKVRRGQRVRRGDIIALTGNTGLSLAPHLHYEVRHRGVRVDPIHYFFMELTPEEYRRIVRIAQSGMQSFD